MGATLFIMVVGRFPLFNPDPFDFLDDLERKEIEIPTNLSLPLQYPFYYFIVFKYYLNKVEIY